MSGSLRPHEWQHARLPCPPSNPRICPNSCSSSQWCYPAISSFDFPFSSCSQSLPASESFPISQLFTWGGQNIGISALASVLPNNTQDWSPLEWTGCTSLQSKGLSRVFSNTTYMPYYCFWPCYMACGILVPWAGMEPEPPALEMLSLSYWTAGWWMCAQLNIWMAVINIFCSW